MWWGYAIRFSANLLVRYIFIVCIIIWRSLRDISIGSAGNDVDAFVTFFSLSPYILPHGWFAFKLYPYTVRRWSVSREMPRNWDKSRGLHEKWPHHECRPVLHTTISFKKNLMPTQDFRNMEVLARIWFYHFWSPFQGLNLSSKGWHFGVPFFAWYHDSLRIPPYSQRHEKNTARTNFYMANFYPRPNVNSFTATE